MKKIKKNKGVELDDYNIYSKDDYNGEDEKEEAVNAKRTEWKERRKNIDKLVEGQNGPQKSEMEVPDERDMNAPPQPIHQTPVVRQQQYEPIQKKNYGDLN